MGIIKKVKDTFFTPKYIKFFVTGLTAFAIDFSFFALFSRLGLALLLANTLSIGISLTANYTINRLWVWKSREKKVAFEFGKFVTVQGFNYVMNNLFLVLFVSLNISIIVLNFSGLISSGLPETLGFLEGEEGNKLLAKFFATAIQMITSFLFYKFFVFKNTKEV
jgi:putative flippase GtrA